MMNSGDVKGMMVCLIIVAGIIGWGAIETLLWIVSHINIGWG